MKATTHLCASILLIQLYSVSNCAVTFTPVTTGPVVAESGYSRSVNFVDIDNDGYLDIFVGNGQGSDLVDPVNFLYANNGDGTFTKITGDTIVKIPASSDGNTWGDFDRDGDVDCYVSTWKGQRNLFFINDGSGNFTRITTSPSVADTAWSDFSAWADYDNDGWLDLMASVGFSTPLANLLFHNNGDSTLSKVSSPPVTTDAARSHGIGWADYDNDGDLDVLVTNVNSNNALYRNDGSGTFMKITDSPFSTDISVSIRCVWGDIDNDLDLDPFITNTAGQNDFLYLNDGVGSFTKITTGPHVTDGAWSNSAAFADIDNDADLDLFVTVGFSASQLNNRLYYNDGSGIFTAETSGPVVNDIGWTHGLAFGDLDRDGDLDLVCARNLNESQENALYLNDGNANHWLDVSCQGTASSRDGVGARVSVKATISGSPLWQMRELTSHTGCGQNGLSAHFGLGDATTLDTIMIRWPAGTTDYYFDVPADQFLAYTECSDSDGDLIGCGDNCASSSNTSQLDTDNDEIGDACDPDIDNDLVANVTDNCPIDSNPGQQDATNDGIGDACCCLNLRGNVNGDVGDAVNVVDLTFLVQRLFQGGGAPPCPNEADANGSGATNVVDLTFLVQRLFQGGPPPPACP